MERYINRKREREGDRQVGRETVLPWEETINKRYQLLAAELQDFRNTTTSAADNR